MSWAQGSCHPRLLDLRSVSYFCVGDTCNSFSSKCVYPEDSAGNSRLRNSKCQQHSCQTSLFRGKGFLVVALGVRVFSLFFMDSPAAGAGLSWNPWEPSLTPVLQLSCSPPPCFLRGDLMCKKRNFRNCVSGRNPKAEPITTNVPIITDTLLRAEENNCLLHCWMVTWTWLF